MATLEETPLGLRLPHAGNPLEIDVERLRSALITADSLIATLHQSLAALNTSITEDVGQALLLQSLALSDHISAAQAHTKAQVGLDHADNTSDADKPVSIPQSQALALKVDKTITLPANQDLNEVVTSGFYRLVGALNMPTAGFANGQLIVSRGADTVLQIIAAHDSSRVYTRVGYGIGTTPNWQPWLTGLAAGDFGLGGVPQTITDCNATPAVNGVFMGSALANAPNTSWLVIHQTVRNGESIQQHARDIADDTRVYTRWKVANVWQPWRWVSQESSEFLTPASHASYLRHGVSYAVYADAAFHVYLPYFPFVGWTCQLLNGWNHFGNGLFTVHISNGAHIINGGAQNVVFNFNVPRVTVQYAHTNTWVLG